MYGQKDLPQTPKPTRETINVNFKAIEELNITNDVISPSSTNTRFQEHNKVKIAHIYIIFNKAEEITTTSTTTIPR